MCRRVVQYIVQSVVVDATTLRVFHVFLKAFSLLAEMQCPACNGHWIYVDLVAPLETKSPEKKREENAGKIKWLLPTFFFLLFSMCVFQGFF